MSAGGTVEIDIHGEDYVPSAVPPAEVMAANKPKKPAKEGKLVCTHLAPIMAEDISSSSHWHALH